MPFPDQCTERHTKPLFTLKEQRSEVKFRNPKGYEVEEVHIDDCVITKGKRCDYLVNVDAADISYFVELKGADVDKAIEQLETAFRQLSAECKADKRWVVSSTRCPLTSTQIQNLSLRIKQRHRGHRVTLTVKNSPVEITIP